MTRPTRRTTATHPLATGPYKFAEYTPKKTLTLVRNDEWDPATDPGRTAYPDGYEMDFTVPNEQIDEIILNDQGDAQNTMTIDDILGTNYRKYLDEAGDRVEDRHDPVHAVLGHGLPQDHRHQGPPGSRLRVPDSAAIRAGGLIEGVNRIPGSNLLAPGTPGRDEYEPLGCLRAPTDPERSKELLAEAGAEGYEIKFLFASDDPQLLRPRTRSPRVSRTAASRPPPCPTTLENLTTVREDPNADINVRSAGWCC